MKNGRGAVLTAALLAAGVAQAGPNGTAPLRTSGEWAVSLDTQGHVMTLTQMSKLKPVLAEPIERAIRGWSFESGRVDGRPQPTETYLGLSIVLEPESADGYAIRVEDANLGGRLGKIPAVRINPRDVREGTYLYVMRVAYDKDGKVVSVGPESGTPEVPASMRRDFEFVLKGATFQSERVSGRPVAAEVVIPMCVSMSRSSRPPANDACEWKAPQKSAPVGNGQLVAVDPAAKLLTEVVGRAL